MEKIKIQYVNEYRKKEDSGLVFIALVSLGFICAIGAMCIFLSVTV